jgi:ubiquinone/menaquinone biosynthesis C-methylase UbiE
MKAEAENLPFESETFDAVVNVESARCYGNIGKFFNEVHRVLKPDGKFLFADMIKPEDIEEINKKLSETGFKVFAKKNIRENVVRALKFNSQSNKEEIERKAPKIFHKPLFEFAGVEGTERFSEFDKSKMEYWSFTLHKN